MYFNFLINVPPFFQRTLFSENRIMRRQHYHRDVLYCFLPFTFFSVLDIIFLSCRISTYTLKVVAAGKILVRHAGGNNYDVSFIYFLYNTKRSTELNLCMSTVNSEYFMCRTVVMMIIINAITP